MEEIARHSCPEVVISDKGRELRCPLNDVLCERRPESSATSNHGMDDNDHLQPLTMAWTIIIIGNH